MTRTTRWEYESAVRDGCETIIDTQVIEMHEKMYRKSQQDAEKVMENAIAMGMTRNDCLLVVFAGQSMV